MIKIKYTVFFLFCLVFILFCVDMLTGVVNISISDLLKKNNFNENHHYILFQYRLPKVLTVMLAGLAISISGQVMQVLFSNPLAGPYVLGVSSGASLGASLMIITPVFFPFLSVKLGAVLGALIVCFILYGSLKYFVSLNSVLILGVLISSVCLAIISILQFFGRESLIKKYLVWSMGSFSNTSMIDLFWLSVIVLFLLLLILFNSKNLQALLLGKDYAFSVGVNAKNLEKTMLIIVSILVGVVTAQVGPIAFVGIIIPFISRSIVGNSNFFILIVVTGLLGVNLLLLSDVLSQRIVFNQLLPINAITSIIGAPVIFVIFIKLSQNNIS